MSFRYVDLFAGIGGFHAALTAMGGTCVYAVEIDPKAAFIYKKNWGLDPLGDITAHISKGKTFVPKHDVLVAGFPCQPFSKSGEQKGMDEIRGTLYWNILQIVRSHKPAVILLENVRNLAGPRHRSEWRVIIDTLRTEKYRVCDLPTIFSPHLLSPTKGGRPQVRERVFIAAVRDSSRNANLVAERPITLNGPQKSWDPRNWNLEEHLPLEDDPRFLNCNLSEREILWINAWDDFVTSIRKNQKGLRLPGFPLWADDWRQLSRLRIPSSTPEWKAEILRKNSTFYTEHQPLLDEWTEKWGVYSESFPRSRRKLEWQAQDTATLWETVMQLRPSGIRAKQATYLPALVAITQTSIIGTRKRRLSPREAARLQGFPDWFDFGDQSTSATYKQLGNSVNIGVVWHVFIELVKQNKELLNRIAPNIVRAVELAPVNPDKALGQLRKKLGQE